MRYTTLLLLLIFVAQNSPAQRRKFLYPPKYLLIQLKSERNRANYFEKTNNQKKLALIKEECEIINKLMIDDFEENFTYCKVYYFYDTNAHLIKEMNFPGVLLNENRVPVKDLEITSADSNRYIIGAFGYSLPTKAQPNATKIGQGLTVLNHNYQSMESPFPDHIYRPPKSRKEVKNSNKQLSFRSKHFDIEYYPVAKSFTDKLEYFFRERTNDFRFPQ